MKPITATRATYKNGIPPRPLPTSRLKRSCVQMVQQAHPSFFMENTVYNYLQYDAITYNCIKHSRLDYNNVFLKSRNPKYVILQLFPHGTESCIIVTSFQAYS